MSESTWVRSVYVYAMCVLAIVTMGWGAVTAGASIAHTISPSVGHRDMLDRVSIGITNVAGEIIDRLDTDQRSAVEDRCEQLTDSDTELAECIKDLSGSDAPMEAVVDGISKVRSEMEAQIRNSAIGKLIRGVLLFLFGLIVWLMHARRTELFGGHRWRGERHTTFTSALAPTTPVAMPDMPPVVPATPATPDVADTPPPPAGDPPPATS